MVQRESINFENLTELIKTSHKDGNKRDPSLSNENRMSVGDIILTFENPDSNKTTENQVPIETPETQEIFLN